MSDIVIKAENIGKKFSKSLGKSMLYGMIDVMKSASRIDPKTEQLRDAEFWAVDDVSFELKKGETLGIMGPNGSGKTTILKMLNGIFLPDRGRIDIEGKTGALIQVGAGFHPMLSGRENIYINGAILGMSKREIDRKFDAIVDFADIGDFLETPVKNYSSGMYVRLGFAIAVYGDPDILLIDEILAVGDMAFRGRAATRMMEIKKKGTAIVFVTHDTTRAMGFCDAGLLIKNGKVIRKDSIGQVIAEYQNVMLDPQVLKEKDPGFRDLLAAEKALAKTNTNNELDILDLKLLNEKGQSVDSFKTGGELKIVMDILPKKVIKECMLFIGAVRSDGTRAFMECSNYQDFQVPVLDKRQTVEIAISPLLLAAGSYVLNVAFRDQNLLQPYGRRGGEDVFRVEDTVPNPEYKESLYRQKMCWKFQ